MPEWESGAPERFRVSGRVLRVTPRFDPRFQPRAMVELLQIVEDLALDAGGGEVMLDLGDCVPLPSLMAGFIGEAVLVATRSGATLRVRMRAECYRRLRTLGLMGMFPEAGEAVRADGVDCVDLTAKPTARTP